MNETKDISGRSQIKPSEETRAFVSGTEITTPTDLIDLKIGMRHALHIIPYDSGTMEQEKSLRRTPWAAKIFDDAFVLSRCSRTDLVILFMGRCK